MYHSVTFPNNDPFVASCYCHFPQLQLPKKHHMLTGFVNHYSKVINFSNSNVSSCSCTDSSFMELNIHSSKEHHTFLEHYLEPIVYFYYYCLTEYLSTQDT